MAAPSEQFDTDLDEELGGDSGSNVQINQAESETPIGSALRQSCFILQQQDYVVYRLHWCVQRREVQISLVIVIRRREDSLGRLPLATLGNNSASHSHVGLHIS